MYFPRYFHPRPCISRDPKVKISGKFKFKPCYNLFIPCPQDVFRKLHYKSYHDNLLGHLKSASQDCHVQADLQAQAIDGLPYTGENFQVREVLCVLRETTS